MTSTYETMSSKNDDYWLPSLEVPEHPKVDIGKRTPPQGMIV